MPSPESSMLDLGSDIDFAVSQINASKPKKLTQEELIASALKKSLDYQKTVEKDKQRNIEA